MRAVLALLLVCAATSAQAQYVNYLRPGVNFNNPVTANLDLMRTTWSRWGEINQSYGPKAKPRGATSAASASAAAAPAPRLAISATDFRPAGPRRVAEQLALAVADAPQRAQFVQACRQIQAGVEGTDGFRKHNLAHALTLLVGISVQVTTGKTFDDAQSDALARIVNDDLAAPGGVFARLSNEQRTQLYDTMVIYGGLIAGIAQNAADSGDPAQAEQARAMAHASLTALGLDGNAVASAAATPAAAAPAANAQIYGLLQFGPPPGQREDGGNHLAFTQVQGRSFCRVGLYVPTHGSNDAAADFRSEWAGFAKARGVDTDAPATRTSQAPNGWTRIEAQRDEQTAQTGRFKTRQISFSGHGLRMSALLLGNDDGLCQRAADAFVASLLPLAPPASQAGSTGAAQTPPAPVTPAANNTGASGAIPVSGGEGAPPPPAITARTWYKAAANYSHWGTTFTLSELAKANQQGYAQRTWDFAPDGRYRYRLEVWAMNSAPKDLTVIEDSGRWRLEGDRLLLQPERVVARIEDKQTHAGRNERAIKREATTYAVRLHYLSGMREWYLVLAPVDGKPTEREGSFDNHPTFPNAYLYGAPPKVNP